MASLLAYSIVYQTGSHHLIFFFLFFLIIFKFVAVSFFQADDGALLGKIEKVRVLRNDRREGRLNFKEVRYKFHCAALSVSFHQVF